LVPKERSELIAGSVMLNSDFTNGRG